MDAIKAYQAHICREDHYAPEEHERQEDVLEEAWKSNYEGPEHQGLCVMPSMYGADRTAALWKRTAGSTNGKEKALSEGRQYRKLFEHQVQFVFSRVQHHWHLLEKGKRVPLKYCLGAKGKRGCGVKKCRGKFPKTKQLTLRAKVVCPGVAKKHGLRISGWHNALGAILSRRRSAWVSGTMPLFAGVLTSNTHTGPNFRVPLTQKTHECSEDCVSSAGNIKLLARLAQRAAKQMVGYFTGYICKRQPIGRYELKISTQNLPLMKTKMERWAPSHQLAQVTNRMFSDLEAKEFCGPHPRISIWRHTQMTETSSTPSSLGRSATLISVACRSYNSTSLRCAVTPW